MDGKLPDLSEIPLQNLKSKGVSDALIKLLEQTPELTVSPFSSYLDKD